VSLRFLAPGLALVALIAGLAEARGLAFYVLLAAIVAAAARGLEAVGEVAEHDAELAGVVLAGVSLLAAVAAAAVRTPGIALLCLVALGLEELGSARARRPVPETSLQLRTDR
jgi:hypothetical protein